MNFKTCLKIYRKQNNLSQKKLSELTKIPQTTISGWERGENSPSINQVEKLCNALGITILELFNLCS